MHVEKRALAFTSVATSAPRLVSMLAREDSSFRILDGDQFYVSVR
jgi:hypothetical protein